MGIKLGIDNINKWAEMLGLGIVTGLDVPPGSEEKGLVPSTEWKKAEFAGAADPSERKWYPGETVNVSIGQGQVTVTPLQAAVMMAAVVNGGNRVRPYLNKSLGPDLTPLPISDQTLEIVTRGLRKCVEKTERPSAGTGSRHAFQTSSCWEKPARRRWCASSITTMRWTSRMSNATHLVCGGGAGRRPAHRPLRVYRAWSSRQVQPRRR